MSEIEKLYENAGVNQVCNTCELRGYKRLCPTKALCARTNPPFTAEKQLELIKKLGNINIDIDNGCYMNSEILKVEAHCDTFEETLAEFVNNLWQDLTEEEKQQIKERLE